MNIFSDFSDQVDKQLGISSQSLSGIANRGLYVHAHVRAKDDFTTPVEVCETNRSQFYEHNDWLHPLNAHRK